MKLYICADKNWAIGKGDRKLVEIPRVYKKMTDDTYSKVIVMGRKTYESLPGGRSIY